MFPTSNNILDDFNRTDEGPPPSANWTDYFNGLTVSGNRCQAGASAFCWSHWNAEQFGPHVEAYVTIAAKQDIPGAGVDLFVRMSSLTIPANGYAVELLAHPGVGNDTVAIYRIDNGGHVQICAPVTLEFNAGDKLGIAAIGNVILAYRWNGSTERWNLVSLAADSAYRDAGYVGLGMTPGIAVDDFGAGAAVWDQYYMRVGVIGDSQLDEYQGDTMRGGPYNATTFNPLEMMVRILGVNAGAWVWRSDVREVGYECNWAQSGCCAGSLYNHFTEGPSVGDIAGTGQISGCAAYVSLGVVNTVLIWIGLNDFNEWNGTYGAIYDGALAGAALQAKIDSIVDNISAAVNAVLNAGAAWVLLANIRDLGLDNDMGTQSRFPNAAYRQRVTDAIDEVNGYIDDIVEAHSDKVALMDMHGMFGHIFAEYSPDENRSIMVDGNQITLTAGYEPHNFVCDPTPPELGQAAGHHGTIYSGIIANIFFIDRLNDAFGFTLPRLSDEQIVAWAGIGSTLALSAALADSTAEAYAYIETPEAPEYIGNILAPAIAPSGTFPIVPDYGYGMEISPQVAVHRFGSANAKIEQRFLLGSGARRFTVRRAALNEADRIALRDFWEDSYGPYGAFTYNAPNDDGNGTTPCVCRFANEPLSWEFLSDSISSAGVALIEIPGERPAYSLNGVVERFPSAALEAALLSQVQEIIPLIKMQPKQPEYPAIHVSDRRCIVGAQLYLPRLIRFDGIAQSMDGDADHAQFIFGNADRVMRSLANEVDLFRASIELSLYHVGTGIKLDLWKGEIVDWTMDAGPEFIVTAADGLYELTLPYPARRITRSCWKCFDDGLGCPYSAQSSGMDYEHFPSADPAVCDKGYDTPSGCLAHGMKHYFGGVLAKPQGVRIKDNSTGVWGYGRQTITSTSIIDDSIYDQVVPEIYTDDEGWYDSQGNYQSGMKVNCKIAAGREEGDFYQALGVVGQGPLIFHTDPSKHTLDNQLHHLYPAPLGRCYPGSDPAGPSDFFSLDAVAGPGGAGGDWRKVVSGSSIYDDNFAAGVAFLVIRRHDEKGIQLSYSKDHQMQATVMTGMAGWIWTAPGVRFQHLLTNPIWIVINMVLRAKGLQFADAATAEQYFDVDAAIAAAAICDDWVPALIGSGLERQFKFRGVLQEEKPLRDWIQEILMNCLGYYRFSVGKLTVGVRINSSALESFTEGNILFQSLKVAPLKPAFNHLTANFADREFDFAGNAVSLYDIDHAKLIGGATAPQFLKSTMNLAGTCTKSQAARIITTRLREELGGLNSTQWKAARRLNFQTTVLALNVAPGMVCSMTHPDMPYGVQNGELAPNYGEFRVVGWKLNEDYSIDIEGRTTVDEMYDLAVGPKPADAAVSPVPTEMFRAGVPDYLQATGEFDDGQVSMQIAARKYNEGIYLAEFRAKFYESETPDYVDLRTPAEGGALVENGTTQRIFSDVEADPDGCLMSFFNTNGGRWYWAARLRNAAGWSVWSDGNITPSRVKDCIDTEGEAGSIPAPWGYWSMDEMRASLPGMGKPAIWQASGLGALGGRYYYAKYTFVLDGGSESLPSELAGPVYLPTDKVAKISWRPPTAAIAGTETYGDAVPGGQMFQDIYGYPLTAVRLVGLRVRSGNNVDNLQCVYRLADGSIILGPAHGSDEGSLTEISLGDDEYFKGIHGSYSVWSLGWLQYNCISTLVIVTNLASYSFGSGGSHAFSIVLPTPDGLRGHEFVGFHGNHGSSWFDRITRLGITYRINSFFQSAMPPAGATGWNLYVGTDPDELKKVNSSPLALSAIVEEPPAGWSYGASIPDSTGATRLDASGNNRDFNDDGAIPVSSQSGKIANAALFGGAQ